jgi:predicted RNA polymerase sigma factor
VSEKLSSFLSEQAMRTSEPKPHRLLPRYRHNVRSANRQLAKGFLKSVDRQWPRAGLPTARPCRNFTFAGLVAALHQGNYAAIPNYLERELRYMDAGERGSKAPMLGHRGPGYQ